VKAHQLIHDLSESYNLLRLIRSHFVKHGAPQELIEKCSNMIQTIEKNHQIKSPPILSVFKRDLK